MYIFSFILTNAIAYCDAGILFVNSEVVGLGPGANPTIMSYNACAVKIYSATSSLVQFVNEIIFFYSLKNAIAYYNTDISFVNSEVVGLGPGANPTIISYNACAVKIYSATSSLVQFVNKIIFFYSLKNAIAYYNTDISFVNSEVVGLGPGANPTIMSYNACAVKTYSGTSSLVQFVNEIIFFYSLKNDLAYYNADCRLL
jgi:uncharacterized membrane protein